MIFKIILWINISLIYAHELDAVRKREWRMMLFADRINDETAYRIFAALHILLFVSVFWLMEYRFALLYWFVSLFGLFHFFLHSAFKKHAENRMRNLFSRMIILLILLFSIAGIILGAAIIPDLPR